MSVTFSGTAKDDTARHGVRFVSVLNAGECECYFNLANVNARAFLDFLRIDTGEDLCGSLPLPEMRRAIIRARATMGSRVDRFTRPEASGTGAMGARWYQQGIDPEYFEARLEQFSKHVEDLAKLGADTISWG